MPGRIWLREQLRVRQWINKGNILHLGVDVKAHEGAEGGGELYWSVTAYSCDTEQRVKRARFGA